MNKKIFIFGLTIGLLAAVLAFKLLPFGLVKRSKIAQPVKETAGAIKAVPENEVIPDQFGLGISFGDAIVKMVKFGAIDKDKFVGLYAERNPLNEEQMTLLEEVSSGEIVINKENSGLILNLLWPLGISNKTAVLAQSPMGTQYKKDVGKFASTGGWSLGREGGGKLFNRFSIVPLTSEQEGLAAEIAQNIYRPCCGNSTYFPDCNHGAAMLGFIELAVAQGMSKEEIYQKALVLNSYWFPQTYVELATYFKAKKNTAWKDVKPEEVLGADYSSGQGYSTINQELQTEGILPKVRGGGGCGV